MRCGVLRLDHPASSVARLYWDVRACGRAGFWRSQLAVVQLPIASSVLDGSGGVNWLVGR